MTRKLKRKNNGLGGMMVCSLLLHAALTIILTQAHFMPGFHIDEAPVYYVEMVNLPVAAPQAGSPAAAGNEAAPPPPVTAPAEMKLPSKSPGKPAAKPSLPVPAKPAPTTAATIKSTPQLDSAREFEERIARMEGDAEAKHQLAALEALKKKAAAGKGKAGMPAAAGKEAGSDYASYLQSRLRDAFIATIAFQTKNPLVRVRLTIGRTGRVIRYIVEQSTGDKLFEESVARAIAKTEKVLTPPPGGENFEQGFVFRPQGVGKN